MSSLKKVISIAGICILALVAVIFILNFKSGSAQEPKNPNLCPPGQEEQSGCKWCQHRVTGKCMWLPADAVAGPWVEVSPPGYCPPLEVDPTSTFTPVPSATATTAVIVTPTATATTVAVITPTTTATTSVILIATVTATSPSEPTFDPLITQAPPATPDPRPRPPHPGGAGNLGYIVLGVTALLGLLAGGALLITGIVRKQY